MTHVNTAPKNKTIGSVKQHPLCIPILAKKMMKGIGYQVTRSARAIVHLLRSPRVFLSEINRAATSILKRSTFFFLNFDRLKGQHALYSLAEEQPVHLRRPSTIPYNPNAFPRTAQPAARQLFALSDALVVGPAATVIFDKRILTEATSPSRRFFCSRAEDFVADRALTFMFPRASRTTRLAVPVSEPIFPLVPFYGHFYYEWILEYLPKLRILEHPTHRAPGHPKILIKAGSPAFVRQSLELLGFHDHIFEWDGVTLRAKRFLFTQHRKWSPHENDFCPSYDDIAWVRERVHRAPRASPQKGSPERLYISRNRAKRGRNIANEDELSDLLTKKGFTAVRFEELSFIEGVRIASRAKVILGPHGAGLVNAIFGAHPTIIEIHTGSQYNSHFFALSEVMGLDYRSIPSQAVGKDLLVDLATLERCLNELD